MAINILLYNRHWTLINCILKKMTPGADPREVKWVNFHPPFFEPPSFFFFSYPSNIDAQTSNTSTRLWFYYIVTKIPPPPKTKSWIHAWTYLVGQV